MMAFEQIRYKEKLMVSKHWQMHRACWLRGKSAETDTVCNRM